MRRWLVVLALLLCLPLVGSGQSINYYPSGGVAELTSSGTAITSTVPILLPDGSATAPAVASSITSSGSYTGFYFDGAQGSVFVTSAGIARAKWNGPNMDLVQNTSQIRLGASVDLILARDAANTLQMGADAATATAQTFKGPDSTGATVAGASLTLKGGAGTSGIANGGALILAGGAPNSTGEPGAVTISDGGTKPTCDSARRGAIWYDAGGVGAADTLEVCRKDAGDAYAWVSLF